MHVQLENTTKRYETTDVVDSVSLSIEKGEIFGLIGPSGSGKSTILRMIAGFETPTNGDIQFDGETVLNVQAKDRDVGLVFQSIALFKNMNVMQNVAFGPRMQGVPKEKRRRNARNILEILDIPELADRDPKNLSGGQKQRVALGRALAIEPEVLLLDEPMTGLDAKLKRRLQQEMVALFNDLDITVIHVTHDQEEAMVMCDRIAILNEGSIEQVGTPAELYKSPKNEFVANFIGTSNLLEATASNGQLDLGFSELSVDINHQGDVLVIARPEHVSVEDGPITADVVNQFYLGEKVRNVAELPDGQRFEFDTEQRTVAPGEEVSLSIDPDRIHVIPRETATSDGEWESAGNSNADRSDGSVNVREDRLNQSIATDRVND